MSHGMQNNSLNKKGDTAAAFFFSFAQITLPEDAAPGTTVVATQTCLVLVSKR